MATLDTLSNLIHTALRAQCDAGRRHGQYIYNPAPIGSDSDLEFKAAANEADSIANFAMHAMWNAFDAVSSELDETRRRIGESDSYTLGIYAHDNTCSVVSVAPYTLGSEYVWITFGEVTPDGFSPSYATLPVKASEIKVMTNGL